MSTLSVVQKAVCNHLLEALMQARQGLFTLSAETALQPAVRYGKADTLMLDALPEVAIQQHVSNIDSNVVFITEESAGKWSEESPLCVIISDPTDRSSPLAEFSKNAFRENSKVMLRDVFNDPDAVKKWEEQFGSPISITGPTTSATCIWEGGEIIFTMILNYITGELVLVANDAVIAYDAKDKTALDFDSVMKDGRVVAFPSRNVDMASGSHQRFVTFLKKNPQYMENLMDSMVLLEDPENFVHYDAPGGPSRPLYLSDFQPAESPIGFVVANGEKLPEWVGWLAFVKAARTQTRTGSLRLFEVFTDRPHMRDGILMSTSPHYSLFCRGADKKYRIDINRLRHFHRPSQFRSMLVVVPQWNFPMINPLLGRNYREIVL